MAAKCVSISRRLRRRDGVSWWTHREKTRNDLWLTYVSGIFAGERIPANTYIGVYAGEYLTDTEGDKRGK